MQSVKAGVVDVISSSKVLIYSKTWCPYCDQAKQIFASAQVEFVAQELDKLSDGDNMQKALHEITGQKTVPNIFIAGQHIGGCSDLQAKIKSGVVFDLLEKAGIPYTI